MMGYPVFSPELAASHLEVVYRMYMFAFQYCYNVCEVCESCLVQSVSYFLLLHCHVNMAYTYSHSRRLSIYNVYIHFIKHVHVRW